MAISKGTEGTAITNMFNFKADDELPVTVRVKTPKLVVGPLELGYKLGYKISGQDVKDTSMIDHKKRITQVFTIKDSFARGKLDVDVNAKKASYSKKFRLPYLNTEVLRLTLSASLPTYERQGYLGRLFDIQVHFGHSGLQLADPKLPSLYSLTMQPKLTVPTAVTKAVRFPGAVVLKPTARLEVSDSEKLKDVTALVQLKQLDAVIRLYDVRKVKPSTLGRRVWACGSQSSSSQTDASTQASAQLAEPDIFDRMAAKSRTWTKHVAVSTCQATTVLQNTLADALKSLNAKKAAESGKK